MKNGVLGAAIETQMNTQLLFCIQVNKQMVKLGKYFADFNFRGSRLTAKIGRRENFPFYGTQNLYAQKLCLSSAMTMSHQSHFENKGFSYLIYLYTSLELNSLVR